MIVSPHSQSIRQNCSRLRRRSVRFVLGLGFWLGIFLAGAGGAWGQTDMVWDPGTAENGTQAVVQPSPADGDYLFRINTKATDVWRTRLHVTAGEADLYLAKGVAPVPGQPGVRTSVFVGSDGLVLSPTDFAPGEDWYILVRATGGSNAWSLVTGAAYVQDLGNLPYTDTNGNGVYNIGEPSANGGVVNQVVPPEGVLFYKVTLPPNVPAWSLWLHGGNQVMGVRKSRLPILFTGTTTADRKQNGNLLLVPPYLGLGSDSYFVGLVGVPGTQISMDSRIQQIETVDFDETVQPFQVEESPPYRVFRVDVPSGEIVWDVSLNRLSGDPSVAIRKESVPSETDNDAVNEAPGEVDDRVSIVAPYLTNGTWYITVYGTAAYETGLRNGTPEITDLAYRSETTNDAPEQTGWRYYRVPDFSSQVGTLGWQINLTNAPPGTEVAIRRAQVPGIWQQRTNGASNLNQIKYVTASSTTGILQRVDHEADIWYVGVYHPTQPLGEFHLELNDITAVPTALDGAVSVQTDQIEGEWRYFRVVVPDDANLLGWYVDLSGVTGTAAPKISVRRDRLPPTTNLIGPGSATWPSGAGWTQDQDFTGVMTNPGGASATAQRFLAATGTGRPLVPGTYYVGVLAGQATPAAGSTNSASYTFNSRGIGAGYSIPVTPLPLNGGSLGSGPLPAREFRFYSVTVPPASTLTTWQLRLSPTLGEMLMQVRRDSLPDFSTSFHVGSSAGVGVSSVLGGKRMKRAGAETLTLAADHLATAIPSGTYYVAVVSEGVGPTASIIGTDTSEGTLVSEAPAPSTHLGTILPATPLAIPIDLAGGDMAVFRMTVPAGMKMVEASLTARTGNPGLSMIRGVLNPVPFPATTSGDAAYGWVGGQTVGTHPVLVSVGDPVADEYTLVVRASASGSTLPRGTATLNIRVEDTLPQLGVTGGTKSVAVTDQFAEGWKYFQLTVPDDDNLLGIRVSLKNVTSGAPRMVIRKGTTMPRDFTTSSGLSADSASWADGQQWYQQSDFTGLGKDASGVAAAGRYFLAGFEAPMGPGTYIIGVSKDSSINTASVPDTPKMNYTLVVESVGTGMDIPVVPVAFNNTASPEAIPALPVREIKMFKVTIPPSQTSWHLELRGLVTEGGPPPGDGGLAIRTGRIPTHDNGADPNLKGGTTVRMINQDDHFTLLPTTIDGYLVAGDYFIAVTSFGQLPTSTQTGSGESSLSLLSKGQLPVDVMPPLVVEEEVTRPYALGAGQVAAYEFVVPTRGPGEIPYGLVLDIDRQVGFANYSLRMVETNGRGYPTPPGKGTDGFFGGLSPFSTTTDEIYGRVFSQIQPGTYRLIVRSSQWPNSSYGPASGLIAARLFLSSDIPLLKFDNENLSVTNAGSTTDILQYRVEIPDEPNWQAWGIRLESPVSGRPGIIVRRGQPVESATGTSVNSDMFDWPLGNLWVQTDDFTKLKNDPLMPSGSPDRDRSQQFFLAARDRPMQPGTYYIGIDNRGTSAISARTFTIRTFAVGEGYSVPVTDISTLGTVAPVAIADPRMPAVFKVTIPPNTRGWAVSLTPTLGDMTLRVRYGYIPDPVNETATQAYPDMKGGVHIQKSGDDRVTLLPRAGSTYLEAGDYYFAAVSEGQNPVLSTTVIGQGEVAGTITNHGPIPVVPLGTVTESGLAQAVELAAAEVKVFNLQVPAGISNLQFRLNNRVGDVSLAVLRGNLIPAPGITESYGVFGGETAGSPLRDRSIVNLGNPTPGNYTIVVRAAGTLPSTFAPGSATLSIDVLKPQLLNFAQELNAGNGLSNVDSRSLVDKQKFFYQVPVPAQVDGGNVLGWLITLEQGSPTVRIYRSESEFGSTAPVTMVGRSALVVPPFLTFDSNWFIEVESVGNSDYVIRSQPVTLTGSPWSLPAAFNQLAGDSNPGAPDGQGIRRQLPQDAWEFFALDVPADNLGLLRLALEQYTGNTNVYVRNDGIPTPDHLAAGVGGSRLYQYKMIAETSEAGNFSEFSNTTKQPERLLPGRYYIGVKSEPLANVRTASEYRLKAHSGVVTDLDLTTTAPLNNQNLAERDWRYFRFTVPRTGIPTEWKPFFSRVSGSGIAYVRDTLPPFSYVPANSTNIASPTFVDWSTDIKNKVPTGAYVKALAPGTQTLPVPPLRPGSTYFLGLYGDAAGGAVNVSSSVSAQTVAIDLEMPYDSGVSQIIVPGNSSRLVRVVAAADATRLKIVTNQSAVGLFMKLEQGAPPSPSAAVTAHAQNNPPYPIAYTFNQVLGTTWPFVPGKDYYLLMTNTTANSITSTLTMQGSNASTEDEDNDGLPDAWEVLHFGNLGQVPGGDFDGDGSTNLQEFENGTLPKNASSVRYVLTLDAPGGGATRTPLLASYLPGEVVSLTATPATGDTFREWKSTLAALNGLTTPNVDIIMSANVTATAIFGTTIGRAVDTPDHVAWSTIGNGGSWTGQFDQTQDGVDAAASPALASSKLSRMTTSFTGPGTLTFWWKVSSLAGHGALSLEIANGNIASPVAAISGITGGWTQVTVELPAGTIPVSWKYSRTNNLNTAGDNRGYVDQVRFVPANAGTYAGWLSERFSSAELADTTRSGPQADFDGDGIPNAVEAAIGTDPKIKNPPGFALTIIESLATDTHRTNTLALRRCNDPIMDIRLEVQASSTMKAGEWTTLAHRTADGDWVIPGPTTVQQVEEGALTDNSVPVELEDLLPLPAGNHQFYRLGVVFISP